ncbi:MAG: GNAT family N-acetyltransferase [Butyricicoccus sp.]
MEILQIDPTNRERIDAFIIREWFTLQMVVHGERIDLGTADGWYACEDEDIIGLITYRIADDEMEILSLDSLRENRGIGTALLNKALSKAKASGLKRVTLITTNDNLRAMQFYQKRGFDMVRLDRNALEQARKLKPEIPLIGLNGIPLRHEIEFELAL